MKTVKNIIYKILPVIMLVVIWVSCKEDEIEALSLSRQFKPAIFNITEGETEATVSWSASLFTLPGEVEYVLELSTTPDFSAIEFTSTTTETEVTILDTEIEIRTTHYARVKAMGVGSTDDSNWLMSQPFQITGEIFILPVNNGDVVTDAAIIHWEVEEVLTKITLTPVGGNPFDVTITLGEYNAGQKLVSGLSPNTTYTAEVFNAENVSKGSVIFTTEPDYAGSNIVDLTGITNKPNILADTLSDIPSGSVVLLKRGVTYTIPAAKALDRSVTITSGPDFIASYASVFMFSNFNLVASSAIDSLVFKDLYMYTDNYAAKYIFNINAIGTIGKVKFENVRGHKFRGFFRLQTGTTGTQVGSMLINNCVIDSLRDFSLVNTNNANAVANIKVTNTTLYNCRKVIDHRSPGNNSIIFENCTFNNLVGGGPTPTGGTFYFIDLGTQNSANPIQITNCIYGKSWNDQGLGDDVRGIQAGALTSAVVTNSYSLSDYISSNETFKIQGLIQFASPSTSVYANTALGDFTIINSSFPGANNAGDPRWRP